MSEQFLELQPALVVKLMKKFLKNEQYIISSNLKSKFSRCLTLFLHYMMSVSFQISKEKHRSTVTIEDLKKALEETGWEEEILEVLDERVFGLGLESSSKSRKIQNDNIEDINKNTDIIEIEEEIKSDQEEEKQEQVETIKITLN